MRLDGPLFGAFGPRPPLSVRHHAEREVKLTTVPILPGWGGYGVDPQPIRERKLDLVEELLALASDAGCSLTHLSLAFVLGHPAVTSAIVGPRTLAQLEDQLGAEAVALPDDVLDRIDALVPPGTDLNPRDAGYVPASLAEARLRRRG